MFRSFAPRVFATALVCLALCAPSFAQAAKRVPTVDDLLMLKSVGGARISPDGRWVAYTVTEANFKADAYVTQIWLADAWDVLSGVDHLIKKGWVDPERVGSMGWSQGGYISAFLTTSTDRFKAISVGAGISNWATYYYNTDITPFTIQYLGKDPADDPAIYAKTSPMSYIKGAKTPTLIQHGENDRRVSIANAYELRQGLEDRGVKTEMIVYKGFGHGITKPRAMRAVMHHNLAWFNHYIWGDPLPDLANMPIPKKEDEKKAEEKKAEEKKADDKTKAASN